MRMIAVVFLLLVSAGDGFAACVCRCLDGEMEVLCDSPTDIRPICPPATCPVVRPSVPPIEAPRLPPLGSSRCFQAQVVNPATGRYEWQRVCE